MRSVVPFWLILCLSMNAPADASWLRCDAVGSDLQGPFAAVTTVTDVGAVPASRLPEFEKRLLIHVQQTNPTARQTTASCSLADDEVVADTNYTKFWNITVRRFGWTNVHLVFPTDWLSASEIKNDLSGF